MKKKLIVLPLALLMAALSSDTVYAQLINNASLTKTEKAGIDINHASPALHKSPAAPILNPKAAARFKARFPGAQSPVWTQKEGYLFVNFILNGQKASAVFTERGRIMYSIISLHQTGFPEIIKDEINETYPSYSVIYAKRITRGYDTVYEVILENCSDYVIIHSGEEEITAIDKLKKSN